MLCCGDKARTRHDILPSLPANKINEILPSENDGWKLSNQSIKQNKRNYFNMSPFLTRLSCVIWRISNKSEDITSFKKSK